MDEISRWFSGMPAGLLVLWVAWSFTLVGVYVLTANAKTRGLVRFMTDVDTRSREELSQTRDKLGGEISRVRAELHHEFERARNGVREEVAHTLREIRQLREQLDRLDRENGDQPK